MADDASLTRKSKKKNLRELPEPFDPEVEDLWDALPRNEELNSNQTICETLEELYDDILTALDGHADRADNAIDNWDMYNCRIGTNQFYNGTSTIYVPIVRDAMEARKTRFTNQLFPRSGRFADCISQDGTRPSALMSLLDFYVRKAHLQTSIVPALIKAGDAEGQYSIYISWVKNKRYTVHKSFQPGPVPGIEIEETIGEEISHAYPHVEVISDSDIIILPVTSDGVEDALARGGCVVILRRWTKSKIKQMMENKEIDFDEGQSLLDWFGEQDVHTRKDPAKVMMDEAGIKKDGRGKYALVYEIWTKLLLPSDRDEEDKPKEKRLCLAYMASRERLLSCRRNPYWSDKIPLISVPKDKLPGICKGKPLCDAVRDFQIAANDAVNMGMDSAHYALMPIVMTDPEKNPNYGSMILTMASIWKTNPNDTQFAQFPQLWKDAFEIVAASRAQIFQTLGVNPAQITQAVGVKKKLNQAEIALEQQVDILTTADAVSVLEQNVLTPMLERFIELDHQFRDEDLTVPAFGEMGVEARMERIPPIQFDRRYHFLWYGVEAARNAQQIQQQISAVNVLRGIPPQLYQGYKLNLVPAITLLVESAFGPRLAPLIFEDMRRQLAQDPEKENEWLREGIDAPVHMMDNHPEHMQSHMKVVQETGDPSGMARVHLMKHKMAIEAAMAQQMSMGQGGQQRPGGAGGPPGQGGKPAGPRAGPQQPPGSLHIDQMHGPGVMPRRAG